MSGTKTVVAKFGGSIAGEENAEETFAKDVAALHRSGYHMVVVHGGGKRVSSVMEQLGQKPVFVDGHRVTTEENMDVVEWILSGEANKRLVALLQREGVNAVGISGRDAGLLRAVPQHETSGRTGWIEAVRPALVNDLLAAGYLPVVSPVSEGPDGGAMNVNADIAAGHLAAAIQADDLVYLTDVDGILESLEDPGSQLPTLSAAIVETNLKEGRYGGGMIPKLQGALCAARAGCAVRVARGGMDGAVSRALTIPGVGTVISA